MGTLKLLNYNIATYVVRSKDMHLQATTSLYQNVQIL